MVPKLIIRNTLAGITTSLAMVPEVVAFALLAHVNPLVGLYAAVILGLVTAIFGGRPGLISGGAGSLAVVSVSLVVTNGVEYLFACIVLMGIIQFMFGVFKLGKLIKLVSPSVMAGFVNGLALVIFLAQFHQLKIGDVWLQGPALYTMIALIVVTVFAVCISPKITKHIPASLAGIVLVTGVVILFGIDTKTVGDIAHISGNIPTFHWPAVPWTLETLWIILPYSIIMAAVGLIETLLTANLVDDLVHHHAPIHKTQPNKESMAQGVGNILTGLFGGMGGCAMIGQTVINIKAGGTHRLAGVVEALAILVYIVFASALIESIPIAALVGVMCVVCYHTFDWNSLKILGKPKQDVAIIVIVTFATVSLNLAYAVILGIVLTVLFNYLNKFNIMRRLNKT
jgi:SulP family sulfate permease